MAKKKTGIDEDVFAVDMEEQKTVNKESEKKQKRSEDPRYWKPRLKKDKAGHYHGSYQAVVRPLPQLGWIEDTQLPFSVEQRMHYIKELKYGLWLYIKCRKTLGRTEVCPVCDANWAVYNAAKERKDEATLAVSKKRIAVESFIGNVLVVADLNHPDLNGEVKLWEHTPKINKALLAPLRGTEEDDGKADDKKGPSLKKAQETAETESFMPYHPTKGRNRNVIIEPPDDNPSMVSYNQSYWDDEASVIGWYKQDADLEKDPMITPTSTDEIISVLEKAHSLKEFIDDVPSAEDMIKQLQEFNDKLRAAGGQPMVEGAAYTPGAEKLVISPKPKEGDPKDFYKTQKSKKDDIPIQEEKASGKAPDTTSDAGGDDEDLPF